jgi:imidazolonepropionase-like amidohydrolase
MRTRLLILVGASVAANLLQAASDGKIALVNGTLIDPAAAKVTPNSLVIIEGDHISSVRDQTTAISTKGARIIDCKGLTPMQILQCATINAARTFGGETGPKIGAIAPGNFADLVILKSNPVDDIAHASDIESVIKNGVPYHVDPLANGE